MTVTGPLVPVPAVAGALASITDVATARTIRTLSTVAGASSDNKGVRTNRNLIEIDGDVVRRWPVQPADLADLPNIAARHEAAREAGLPVPRVLKVAPDHLVLERVHAVTLFDSTLDLAAQHRLGRDIAAFLAQMRGVRTWPVPFQPWAQLWQTLYDAAPTPATRVAAQTASAIEPALTHGDLSWGNLLVTPAGELVAVIDWDAATLADPAQDYQAVCFNAGPDVAWAVREHTPDADQLLHRAQIYLDTWQLQHDLWAAGRHPCLG